MGAVKGHTGVSVSCTGAWSRQRCSALDSAAPFTAVLGQHQALAPLTCLSVFCRLPRRSIRWPSRCAAVWGSTGCPSAGLPGQCLTSGWALPSLGAAAAAAAAQSDLGHGWERGQVTEVSEFAAEGRVWLQLKKELGLA